ncbi:IclR family transcriptional regulator [Microbacterium sp. RD1]|uniref:IclR family transcriptional regulator n=1 Tax=Microbacterium sp. RD1 TaxID=3457313 RepID=UPI003FA5AF9B
MIERAFRLLDVFTAEDPALTLSRLAHASGLPTSTTLRLCRQLVKAGALERLPDGRYAIGIRMLEYAALAPRGHGLRALALPYMEDLHRATRQHVQLAVREGESVVIVERLSAPRAGRVLYHVGARVPLHHSGLGTVLLAHADADFRAAYTSSPRQMLPEGTPVSPALTRELLAQVVVDGFGRFSREHPEPVDTIAAPIFDRVGQCVAALSVLGTSGSLDGNMVESAVVAISRAISRDLARLGPRPRL